LPAIPSRFLPWRDRAGRLSPLKAAAFAALFVPGLATLVQFELGQFAGQPIKEMTHETGLWAIRFLYLSLAVTPLRFVFKLPRLLLIRRMLGVAAFAYACLHLSLFVIDKAFDFAIVATEIALRIYLTIGFATVVTLAALAATSTDAMVKRLGAKRWQALHRAVYAAALLATVHFFMQSKLEVAEPTVMAGLGYWLIGYRIVSWTAGPAAPARWPWLAGLAVAGGVLAALTEAFYVGLLRGANPLWILAADINPDYGLRPPWIAFLILIAIPIAALARDRLTRPRPKSA